jgi:hypothetical protein
MIRSRYVFTSVFVLGALGAVAQTAPEPAPAAAPTWSAGPIEFSGLVDAYYSLNFNHPASKNNVIRNFDVKANQFSLNFAKLRMEHAADPVGFVFELAAGRAMDVFHATDPAGSEVYKHILQAYVSVKPPGWKGFQVDVGKFVTSAGAEVTETHLNWNYSRSLLYANGPYYHMGIRTAMPVNGHVTLGAQLLNGWNNVEDNNSAKTVGLTTAITTSKFNWFNNYYVGNEKTDTFGGVKVNAPGVRHFYDTVLNFNPNGKVSGLLNFDYGIDKNPLTGDAKFYGTSVAAKFAANDHFYISPRYDWYKDQNGFITATAQTIQEFTLTGDIRMKEGFALKLEYRRDWSNEPFFDRGNGLANAKSQNTLLAGFMVFFGPKR